MADLIERDKLLEYIDDNFYPTTVSCYMTAAEARAARERHNMFIDAINNAPTVDTVPVAHGIWVHHKGGFSDHYDCTVCGKDIVLTKKWMYCPNCGAKMDGDCDE